MTWLRVSKARPCLICHKSDWCTYTEELSCCMRVQSERPAGNGGWFHGGAGTRASAPVARRALDGYEGPDFNAQRWWETVRTVCRVDKLTPWAEALGLPMEALDWMGACTLGPMLTFPMYDGTGAICGIRTRNPDGAKRAVTGSRAGVFLPTVHMPEHEAMVCEGPTDSAAAVALGFEPIGRPSCAGCERHVVDTCRRLGRRRVTICADGDGPGIAGAKRLADVLRAARLSVRLVTPGGHKDLRDWWRGGATREHVDAAWSQAEWRG